MAMIYFLPMRLKLGVKFGGRVVIRIGTLGLNLNAINLTATIDT